MRAAKRFFYPDQGTSFSVSEAIAWIRCFKRIKNVKAARRWERWLLSVIAALSLGCGPDVFVRIAPAPDAGELGDAAPTDASYSDRPFDAGYTDGADVGADVVDGGSPDADADAAPAMCDPGDVTYAGKCFYLDGTAGACSIGYTLSSEAALAGVLGANPNAFQGKNYRSAVSANCCVDTVDVVRNYGMASHCNVGGPFGAGEPRINGNGCANQSGAAKALQITLCERAL